MNKHVVFMSIALMFFSCNCLAVCSYELEGDVNDDCVVDLLDVASMAGNWLVNCNTNPSDPACDTTQAMTDLQEDQFRYIKDALELYRSEFGEYPPSNDNRDVFDPSNDDPDDPTPYGGANKLAEALVGLDQFGFHSNSDFRSDGINVRDDGYGGVEDYAVYHATFDDPDGETAAENVQVRKGPFIDLGVANAFAMQDIYLNVGQFRQNDVSPSEIDESLVLCDVFESMRDTGNVTGMPILYYRARDMFVEQDWTDALQIRDDIYYYFNNFNLLMLGPAYDQGEDHPLSDGSDDWNDFEDMILDPSVTTLQRPYRPDGYILISAGPDGEYGTADDLFDFELLADEPLPIQKTKEEMQEDQFRYIKEGLELFREEFGDYPPSINNRDALDPGNDHPDDPTPYCGANKLAEALVGLDELGFHANSDFRSDGINLRSDGYGGDEDYAVYHATFDDPGNGLGQFAETAAENVQVRKGPFIDLEVANVFTMQGVYENIGQFRQYDSGPSEIDRSLVLCDVFEREQPTGKTTGMPILYYRARDILVEQNWNDGLGIRDDIYYYMDNMNLLALGPAADQGESHPLNDGSDDFADFEDMILDPSVTTVQRPYRANGYILISAGADGMYGTADDLFDFELLADEPLPVPESKDAIQMAQLDAIAVGLELYKAQFGDYPPSNDNRDVFDPSNDHPEDPTPYGGANKLAEALAGLDTIGVHPNSDFRSDGINIRNDGYGGDEDYAVYHATFDDPGNGLGQFAETAAENIQNREGPYISTGVGNIFTMQDVFENVDQFRQNDVSPSEIDRSLVLCDIFVKDRDTGKMTGMPVLYFKARTNYAEQDRSDGLGIRDDIYYLPDNRNLLNLDISLGFGYGYYPDEHVLGDGADDQQDFENMILDPDITILKRPYNADSYILISAGEDGIYGTGDDITNFGN
jgi:hypothetical protein